MKDCRVMNIGAVEGEDQILGDSQMVEYVGWGGVIGNIGSVEDDEPTWEPIGGRMIIEPILGDINEVERLEPTWRKKVAKGHKIKKEHPVLSERKSLFNAILCDFIVSHCTSF